MKRNSGLLLGAVFGMVGIMMQPAAAAEIKVLTTGAFKSVVVALVPEFEKATGHQGGRRQRHGRSVAEAGRRRRDVRRAGAVAEGHRGLHQVGKIAAGSSARLAKVGVGVMVKEGAPKPDVSTVDAFKKALLAAKSVGYIDPASGGQAESMWRASWTSSASPIRSSRRPNCRRAVTCPTW
jgi:molybdate transport system substrate-binding protein